MLKFAVLASYLFIFHKLANSHLNRQWKENYVFFSKAIVHHMNELSLLIVLICSCTSEARTVKCFHLHVTNKKKKLEDYLGLRRHIYHQYDYLCYISGLVEAKIHWSGDFITIHYGYLPAHFCSYCPPTFVFNKNEK